MGYFIFCSVLYVVESTSHFFLHCTQRLILTNKLKDIDKPIFDKNDSLATQALHFGDD